MEVRVQQFIKNHKWSLFFAVFVLSLATWVPQAEAGFFEFSLGLSYNRSDYGGASYSWSRRYGTSLGYHFNEQSGLEFSFQDVLDRTYITNYEDTTFHDQIYGLNWLQGFGNKSWPVQPYVRAGIGLLNREAAGSYPSSGASPPVVLDSITGILGAGLRIYLTKTFAIRTEATSYMPEGDLSTWNKNFAVSFGISVYF